MNGTQTAPGISQHCKDMRGSFRGSEISWSDPRGNHADQPRDAMNRNSVARFGIELSYLFAS